jgi:IS30 family transposase
MSKGRKSFRLEKGDRHLIENLLDEGLSVTEISRRLDVATSTISREIKAHRIFDGYMRNAHAAKVTCHCIHALDCNKTHVCTICVRYKASRCASCQEVRCTNICSEYVKQECLRILRAPHVCNGCRTKRSCRCERWHYSATVADKTAQETLQAARCGIDAREVELSTMVKVIRPLLAKGQSPAQIWLSHADEFPVSKRTFYRYVEDGLFGFTALDLRCKVRYKKRHRLRQPDHWKVPAGHTFDNFKALDDKLRECVVEMDCVEGTHEEICAMLTLHVKAIHFQMGFMLDVQDRSHVIDALDWLEDACKGTFKDIFGLMLTDRGLEFHDTAGIEKSGRTRLYYCDARHAEQKGACEKNHEEIRKVIPKGRPLAKLTQYKLAEMFSHINSTPRRSLGGMSPMQLAQMMLPKKLLDELGYRLIPADEVTLIPKLAE